MTNYAPNIDGHHGPKYRAIAEAIARDIAIGQLEPETRLPPQRDLAWRLGVTIGTVSRAYAEIARQGLVHGEVGRGTYVLGNRAGHKDKPLQSKRLVDGMDMTRNAPPQGPHAAALAETLGDIAHAGSCAPLLEYREEAGPLAHRQSGVKWLARIGLEAAAENLVVVGGAQQGLALSIAALSRPGETILVEELTYCQFLDAAAFQHRPVHPVAMDADGILPEALDAACQQTGARVVFLIPTLHNPTTSVMPMARRQAIAEIARRRDLVIIEDDVYGYLPESRPAPIATLAPDHTVYVTSISKSLAPGLRLGWLAAPPRLVSRLVEAQMVTSVAQPPLTGEVARRWIDEGVSDVLLRWLRREVAERNDIADEMLGGLGGYSHPMAFHRVIRLPQPWSADNLVAAARTRGVGVLPLTLFAAQPGAGHDAIRISLTQPRTRGLLRDALAILRDLIEHPTTRPRAII